MRVMIFAKSASAIFALGAILLFSLGAFSLNWPKVNATVESSETQLVTIVGYGMRGSRGIQNLDVEHIEYSYTVGGLKYVNSQVCYCLPLGWKHQASSGDKIDVSYLLKRPQWSVLEPGPDMMSVAALLALSILSILCGNAVVKVLDV